MRPAIRRRATVAGAAVLTAASFAVTSCGHGAADHIDYAVDGTLLTYNTNTVAGAASSGPQAFARVLTGFGYHGPDGQVVGDHDFGSVAVVGREPLVLDYQIADNAVYSDGKPITCDDMVLAWAAQSGRFPGFDAASKAGYIDITGIDCQPGQKKARVSFAPGRSIADYPQLFTATSLMPSHVISDELGLGEGGTTVAVQQNDPQKLAQIAQVWNTTWDLHPGLDRLTGDFERETVADRDAERGGDVVGSEFSAQGTQQQRVQHRLLEAHAGGLLLQLQEAHVEGRVVRHQHRIGREGVEGRQHLQDVRLARHHVGRVAHEPGVAGAVRGAGLARGGAAEGAGAAGRPVVDHRGHRRGHQPRLLRREGHPRRGPRRERQRPPVGPANLTDQIPVLVLPSRRPGGVGVDQRRRVVAHHQHHVRRKRHLRRHGLAADDGGQRGIGVVVGCCRFASCRHFTGGCFGGFCFCSGCF